MKRFSIRTKVYLLGLVAGAAGMAFLLSKLPPAGLPAAEPGVTRSPDGRLVESFYIDLTKDGVAVTHGGGFPLGLFPQGIARLEEPGVRGGLGILTKVRDRRGDVIGFAAELEVHPEGNVLQDDLEWSTDWVVVIPGRGTLYLHERERSGELGPKVIGPALASGRAWTGDWTVQTTSGPGPGGRGLVLGGTHDFEGAKGNFVEVVRLTGFLPEGVLVGALELRLNRE
jgi:hypothetical protein